MRETSTTTHSLTRTLDAGRHAGAFDWTGVKVATLVLLLPFLLFSAVALVAYAGEGGDVGAAAGSFCFFSCSFFFLLRSVSRGRTVQS